MGSNDPHNGWRRQDATNPLSSSQEWDIPDTSSWVSAPGNVLFPYELHIKVSDIYDLIILTGTQA